MADRSIGATMQRLLEQSFERTIDLELEHLPNTCDAISNYIQSATQALLFEELLLLRGFHGKQPSQPTGDYVCIRGGVPYLFSAQPGPNGTENFNLAIVCADARRSKLESLDPPLPLSASTPFKCLVTQSEANTAHAARHLSALCKESVDSGYLWLEQFCIKAIENDKSLIVDELYRVVRSAVPDYCANHVWLYMLVEGASVYVFDKLAQRGILDSSRQISSRFARAPADTIAKLAGRVAKPQDTSDFRRVIPENKTYIHDPVNGISEGDSIALPQYILFGGHNHCIQPLVGKESGALDTNAIWLTAVYPIPMRGSIEKPLAETRPRLERLLRNHRSVRSTIIGKMKRAPSGEEFARDDVSIAASKSRILDYHVVITDCATVPMSQVRDKRSVFVIHGRNADARNALFSFLRAINLAPIEWEEAIQMTGQGSPFIGNVLDFAFARAQAAIVLLTGDDVARLGKYYLGPHDGADERIFAPRARQNVLFEAGMAFGKYPERTIFVAVGATSSFSDIAGRHLVRLSDKVESRQKLADRLRTSGCDVRTEGRTDWHTEGMLDAAVRDPDIPDIKTYRPLVLFKREASFNENSTHKRKVWIQLKNQTAETIDISEPSWTAAPGEIQGSIRTATIQQQLGGQYWCPEKIGVNRLQLPPNELCRVWIVPAENLSFQNLTTLCQSQGLIGTLSLLVNGVRLSIPV